MQQRLIIVSFVFIKSKVEPCYMLVCIMVQHKGVTRVVIRSSTVDF